MSCCSFQGSELLSRKLLSKKQKAIAAERGAKERMNRTNRMNKMNRHKIKGH
jgi:hypothetical protein